jgi:O-antigen/teichoic acid export membrane protein
VPPGPGASLTRGTADVPQQNEEAAALLNTSAPDVDARSAVFLAIKNAFTLGGALVFTWSIGLAIRVFVLPRHLGPTDFGTLNWADAFTTTLFVVLGLGMEQYIRKEVAVRPAIANEFYGGSFLVRIAMTAGLLGIIVAVLLGGHRSGDVIALVILYALTQFAVTANGTLGAMLHAKGRVRGQSILSVVTKVVWAVGILLAIATNVGFWPYGASFLASEAIEVVVLTWLAKEHLGLVFRVDWGATKRMLLSSLPYYVAGIATTAYGKLDVSLLEFTAGSKEVGLYGAAAQLTQLTLLITPIIGWVLTPMLARAADRSRKELFDHVCRSMELILSLAMPVSLVINLGADFWIHLIFGAPYAGAVTALRVLATMVVLTYAAIIYAMTLVMLERAWTVAWISIAGLVVNAGLNLLFVRYSVPMLGEGGGGTGCAAAALGTEICVTLCMGITIGPGAFDRRSVSTVARGLAVYAVVVGVHLLLGHRLGAGGALRVLVDAVLYIGLAIAVGALRPREMLSTVREAMRKPAHA